MDRLKAQQLLQTALGNPLASFRAGQWEAIDALVNHRQKLLVVQRTGWGKSAVYFISARIFRDKGLGLTIIISPLLALMRNQISAAERLGLNAKTMNSTNTDDWQSVTQQILDNQVDCLLISPERLANDTFVETVLQPIADRIALMVVDEAHCISDWGHDFRPDYRRLVSILRFLPVNTPVLGTTATANNRVIADIKTQLGDIQIQRGSLIRDSLSLHTMQLPDQSARLAWLVQTIPTLQGTGIVYALTKHDAEQVTTWLRQNGILARAYYSGITHSNFSDSNAYRERLEAALINNELKVLVATTALGMGYDKPDLSFVIHYQSPNSIVTYYQQIGRAGRAINTAYGILLAGKEDNKIHEFFRKTAFPAESDVWQIIHALEKNDGLSLRQLEENTNLRYGQIEHTLKFLSVENPAPVIKIDSKWHRTPVTFTMNHQRIQRLTQQREIEWQEIQDYVQTKKCLMNFLRNALDDEVDEPCGRCAICFEQSIISAQVDAQLAHQAMTFLKHAELLITPKIQVAANAFVQYGFRGNLPVHLKAQEGRVLSHWGDAGWGKMVSDDKHQGYFRDELVMAIAEMIKQRWRPEPFPAWVCCVPSLQHSNLVPDFAQRLAKILDLPFKNAVKKIKSNEPQKLQQNRFHQCRNLDGVFAIDHNAMNTGAVLLVDDIIDSGWTFAVIAALLQQAGSGKVYPVALASSSTSD